jgi:hypothetical protein
MRKVLLAVVLVGLAHPPAFASSIPIEVESFLVNPDGTGAYWVRTWSDTNRNYIPDCDLFAVQGADWAGKNGECGAIGAITVFPSGQLADPGPGGSNSVLTFNTPSPFLETDKSGDAGIPLAQPGDHVYVPNPTLLQPGAAIIGSGNTPQFYVAFAYDFISNGTQGDARFNGADLTLAYYGNGTLPTSFYSNSVVVPAAVPEPATLTLAALGLAGVVKRYRRRRPRVGNGTPKQLCG